MLAAVSALLIALTLHSSAFAEYTVVDGEAGQQAVLSDTRNVTVFRDTPITAGGQIGAYFDSSALETEGIDRIEWYYLKRIGYKEVVLETLKYDLKLPSYVSENEKRSETTVKLPDSGGLSGIFVTHDVKIRVTVTDASHVQAEIEK